MIEFANVQERYEFLKSIPMKSDFKFKFIDNFDVSKIEKLLIEDGFSEDKWHNNFNPLLNEDGYVVWSELDRHQKPAKNDASFRFIIKTAESNNIENPLVIYSSKEDQHLLDAIQPIITRLEKEFGDEGKVTRAYFAKIVPGEIINPHTDSDLQNDFHQIYFRVTHKYHIPITTNDGVWTQIDGETKHFKIGECWDYNNNLIHSGGNKGETDRIHLIVEISPYSWL